MKLSARLSEGAADSCKEIPIRANAESEYGEIVSMDIRPVSGNRDIRAFIRLPYGIYRGSGERWDAWVPPLNMDLRQLFRRSRNPMYHHTEAEFWLAWENGEPAGRVAAFIDQGFIDYQKTKTGFFGFFECRRSPHTAAELLETVNAWLGARGMERCIGPVNGSTNFQLGNQIDSFDEMPVIDMPYSPPFYGELIEGAGFAKSRDLYSYRMNVVENPLSEKIRRVSRIAAERNRVTIRSGDLKNWDNEVGIIRKIWEDAWRDNWGFTPWYEPEFREMAGNMKMLLIPQLTYIAEIEGEAAGFCLPIPDVNPALRKINGRLFPTGFLGLLRAKKTATRIRVAAFGVVKKHQNKGIDGIMINHLTDDAVAMGIHWGEFSWILETNMPLRNLLENWGAERYRTHRIYQRPIGTPHTGAPADTRSMGKSTLNNQSNKQKELQL